MTLFKKGFTLKRFANEGFTLIELLVTIGILAVISAGVFALIDPVDKTRMANDARMQGLISEAAIAEEAYASTHNGCYSNSWAALNTAGELKLALPAIPAGYAQPVFTNGAACVGGTATEVVSTSISAILQAKKYAGLTFWKYETLTGKTCNVAAVGTACL